MVYRPRDDSYLLAKEVRNYAKGKSVLDMGSGSGIQAIMALESGAGSVLAVDIDEVSVKELKEKGINAIKSDLFSNIEGKFDLIIFNPPYLPFDSREDIESRLYTSGGKRGDEIIVKFLKDAGRFLNNGGIILIVISSLTPLNGIKNILKQKKLKREVIAVKKFFMERLEVWKISSKD